MSDVIRAYVNGKGVDVAAGATALDAVRAYDPDVADQVTAGDRALTDSRGLPLEPDAPIVGGSIMRVVSGRRRGTTSEGSDPRVRPPGQTRGSDPGVGSGGQTPE